MKIESNKKKQNRKKRSGFTLIELLVVISIIALLLSILVPSLSKAKKQAQAVICLSRLKQLTMASYTYAYESDGNLPPLYDPYDGSNFGISWLRYMVPYISLAPGLSTGDHDVYILNGAEGPNANEAGNKSVLACPAAVRLCTASLPLNSPTYARNSYGFANTKKPVKLENCSNSSGTIFLGDALITDIFGHGIANANPLLGPSKESGARGTFFLMDPEVELGYHRAPHDGDVNLSWYDGHVSKHDRLEYDVYEDNTTAWKF